MSAIPPEIKKVTREPSYAAAYAARARDRVLSDFAERVVHILVDMGAPGAQWLDLSPLREGA